MDRTRLFRPLCGRQAVGVGGNISRAMTLYGVNPFVLQPPGPLRMSVGSAGETAPAGLLNPAGRRHATARLCQQRGRAIAEKIDRPNTAGSRVLATKSTRRYIPATTGRYIEPLRRVDSRLCVAGVEAVRSASSSFSAKRESLRRGGRAVECTALEMRHARKGIGGSNPPLSASARQAVERTNILIKAEPWAFRLGTHGWYTWPLRWLVLGSTPEVDSSISGNAFRTMFESSSGSVRRSSASTRAILPRRKSVTRRLMPSSRSAGLSSAKGQSRSATPRTRPCASRDRGRGGDAGPWGRLETERRLGVPDPPLRPRPRARMTGSSGPSMQSESARPSTCARPTCEGKLAVTPHAR